MRILVIDDEPLIHISIEKLIQKYSEDIEVYHAYNGQEMQAFMQKYEFQLAYVDIKLPGMSGLEAIRLAKEVSPHTVYYIMTGFDSFEFAKEAIKLKVEDYLMKPLDFETIKNSILSAQNIHDSNNRERKNLFRHWLESILNNRECTIERYNNYYRFAILIATDQPDFPVDVLLEKLMPYNDNFVSTYTGNHILILCFSENVDFLRNLSKELSSQTYSHGITMFISSIVKSSKEMKTSIEYLIDYSSLRVILGIEKCYPLKPLLNYSSELVCFCHLCETWQNAYRENKFNEFVNASEAIGDRLFSDPGVAKYESNVLAFIQMTASETLRSPISQTDLRMLFQRIAAKLVQSSKSERLVDSIVQYLQEHFCDNISTTALSERFGLSSNYITNLLKQELGIRYNDYITQLRMEYAKELLLSTNKSVKNITMDCGYYSQSHFTKLFVEKEGCTPLEYRKRHAGQL